MLLASLIALLLALYVAHDSRRQLAKQHRTATPLLDRSRGVRGEHSPGGNG